MNRLLFCIGLFVCVILGAQARTWTQKKSGKTITADFVRFSGDKVVLKRSVGKNKGKEISILISSLSLADQKWLDKKGDAINKSKTIPKHKAEGVEDLENEAVGGVKDEVKQKSSNMIMNMGWCVLVLAEFMFFMAGMKNGLIKGIIAAVPLIGWVFFALTEWQYAKVPLLISIVGGAIVAGGYVVGGGSLR